MKIPATIFLLLGINLVGSPVARPVLWADVGWTIQTWRAVNPSGSYSWARSLSMLPGIRPGDLLLAEAYVGQPLKGEIPVYKLSAEFPDTSHECIAEGKTWFIAKGTNNPKADPQTDKSKVKWVIVAILRPQY